MVEQPIRFYSTMPEPIPKERECGECNQCCKWLYFSVNGNVRHPGKPCFYLGENCTIHEVRPQVCRDYHCAYIQGIVPEWMKPSLSNVMISTEKWGPNKEYKMLRAVECGQKLDSEVLSWLIQYSRNTGVGLMYQLSGHYNYFGPDLFMQFFRNEINRFEFEENMKDA